MKKIKSLNELLEKNYSLFLRYHKTKFPMFHNSNVFFKDLIYSVKYFVETQGEKVNFDEAAMIAKHITQILENKEVFVKVAKNTYRLNYEKFKTGNPILIEN